MMTFHTAAAFVLATCVLLGTCDPTKGEDRMPAVRFERRLTVSDYRDRMTAGWIGQMAGVAWGAPVEFRYRGEIMPREKVPQWKPSAINDAYKQDDLYVDVAFLDTLGRHGLGVSLRQAGIDFANTQFPLWSASHVARCLLHRGVAPPDTGHPSLNDRADAIDFQIMADFAGLIAPGLPNTAIDLCGRFGRIVSYGDGLYGGQFMAGMYAEAFFERDPRRVVKAGLKCIPAGSQYAEAIRDVLRWQTEFPNDWGHTWRLIQEKYHLNPTYRRVALGSRADLNIDAKLNGAYAVMGLLYGAGDPIKTITIAMRCGQDADCNPASAAGVLFTMRGTGGIPETLISGLDRKQRFWLELLDKDIGSGHPEAYWSEIRLETR